MNKQYTAVIKQESECWIGWIKEIPGVNCQEYSKEELINTLKVTLEEALEFNEEEAISAIGSGYNEEIIVV
jgi:predicted RNase H-like HicB family nuclease